MKRLLLLSFCITIVLDLRAQSATVPGDGYYFIKKGEYPVLYDHGANVNDLISCWAGSSLVAYSDLKNSTYILKDYETAVIDITYPAEKLNTTDHYAWRTNGKSFWVYYKAKVVTGFRSFWMGSNLVVYDTISNLTHLLPAYKTATVGTIYPTVIKNLPEGPVYFTNNKSYWVYKNGSRVAISGAFWNGNHLNVYDSINQITYELTNYKSADTFNLYPTTKLFTGENYLWYRNEGFFWVYYNCEVVENTKSFWIGEHLGIYDPASNTTFLMVGYETAVHGKIYPATKVKSESNLFWWTDDKYYYIADKGVKLNLEQSNSFWYKDDIVVFSPENNTTYLLEGYPGRINSRLYEPRILSSTETAFWWQVDGSYYIYDKGNYLENVDNSWENDNLIITDKLTGRSFTLENYNQANDGLIRIAYLRK